jgi:hypothetical protein
MVGKVGKGSIFNELKDLPREMSDEANAKVKSTWLTKYFEISCISNPTAVLSVHGYAIITFNIGLGIL